MDASASYVVVTLGPLRRVTQTHVFNHECLQASRNGASDDAIIHLDVYVNASRKAADRGTVHTTFYLEIRFDAPLLQS